MRPILLLVLLLAAFASAAQVPDQPPLPRTPAEDKDERLPNGKSQKDAIAKQAYERSLADARDLVKTAQELQSELEKNNRYVVSISEIRKTEEIEKLAKRIRGRLKTF